MKWVIEEGEVLIMRAVPEISKVSIAAPERCIKAFALTGGKECEVPFQPTGDRPVYCAECWAKNRPPRTEDHRRREYPREDRQRRPSPASENVDLQILAELKRIRELLEKGANKDESKHST
ncbi:MAG: CxxC-x17-CxxC domain-containing protein [Candidatus Bathyarchaeia archaeon]